MITDARRVSMYRSGRRIATSGDLREPIVLARSVRVPDTMSEDPVGYVQSFQPYATPWASVTLREKKMFEGTDVDEAFVHLFYIRNDTTLSIEETDVVVYKEDFYAILTTRVIGQLQDFMVLRTKYAGRIDGARFDNGALRGPNTEAPAPVSSGDVFADYWNQVRGDAS